MNDRGKPSWQQQASRRIFVRSSPNGRRGEPSLIPLSPKVHLLGHDSTCRGGHFGSGPRRSARGRPKAVFLLLACCTQEEDAGSGPHPQHVTPLAFIGPEGIVTVRTGGPRLRPSLQSQIRAIAAKPPRLDLGNLQVYLIEAWRF